MYWKNSRLRNFGPNTMKHDSQHTGAFAQAQRSTKADSRTIIQTHFRHVLGLHFNPLGHIYPLGHLDHPLGRRICAPLLLVIIHVPHFCFLRPMPISLYLRDQVQTAKLQTKGASGRFARWGVRDYSCSKESHPGWRGGAGAFGSSPSCA